ncbi:MAG: glycosyltransferase [Clostridia bacterium]|nr:glycosyltransferase [Clostridia bacterium]
MKKIAFFCIPAHGHTNPMLPVAEELVKNGNQVRFYSFKEFQQKIEATGAVFVSCSDYLTELTKEEQEGLKTVSTTEMTIQDIRITLRMNSFLEEEFRSFQPDIVFTDSVCFWGKLNAWKHQVPLVVSTSTFAFNQLSSQYMKHSPKEMADMIFGLPRISKELKTLAPYGYQVKSALKLVQSDNQTDSIVYTSKRFQPYAESFSDHYAFVGPSVFSKALPDKKKARPLVYISMGTVINDKPDYYQKCIQALKDEPVDVIISCGHTLNPASLNPLPTNVQIFPSVDQLDVLSKADVFITHCGMNSVSESLYMATPMVLFPQTGEQKAVAQRAVEINAGVLLTDDSVNGIRTAVMKVLNNAAFRKAAQECSDDFRACSGPAGAAAFIASAPHVSNGVDIIKELNQAKGIFQMLFWLFVGVITLLISFLVSWKYVWIIVLAARIISSPIGKALQKRKYASLVKKYQNPA